MSAGLHPPRHVLYVTYNGLTEPLGRRQVLPYLLGLADRGWTFSVLSFEKADHFTADARDRVTAALEPVGIAWSPASYHRSPPVLATAYDTLRGWVAGARMSGGAGLLHARSTVSAWMVRWLGAARHSPWIFDVRGLVAQEYVDAAHWARRGILHRVVSQLERRLLARATGLVFLTRRIHGDLVARGQISGTRPARVIPCCVDTKTFRPSQEDRARIRQELGLGQDPVLVYSGSLGSWYKLDEMLDFYGALQRQMAGSRFLILTPHVDIVREALRSREDLAPGVTARRVAPDDVPAHLAAADAGICYLGDLPSKRASSPTKYGEYLASGLPVVTNTWTGDAADLDSEAWITVDDFGPGERDRAAQILAGLLNEPQDIAAQACSLASREFALEVAISRYDSLYGEVLERWRKPGA